MGQRESSPRPALVIPLAGVLTLVWVAAAVGALLSGEYVPLEVVSPPFLLMCGYVFGVRILGPAIPPNGKPDGHGR